MARWLWAAGAVALAAAGVQAGAGSMDSLVQAERAFARTSVQTSQREAFLANFADDGVWFSPGPENTKDALRKQPAPASPPARTLDWEPTTGDVAASGDLGYTTGPYVSTPRAPDAPPRTGWFFSVWRWRGDVRWKVAADFGIECPASGPLRPNAFKRAEVRAVQPKAKAGPKVSADEVRAAEAAFAALAGERGLQAAYGEWSTKDVLVYRQGSRPLDGRVAVLSVTPSAPLRLTLQLSHAEASQAGDLGFTYGAYTEAAERGEPKSGYYLHVWKRLADGWKLAVDVTNQ
jgi:ketosteroid isomerase-like protein